MPIKIAVSGKGGVGKTTVAALLASQYARLGRKVIAVDADPASSLPSAIGIPKDVRAGIVPLSQMLDLIQERTGARPGESYGSMFSLNPRVDDLVERYAVRTSDGVDVLVLGTIRGPGSGCFCPENALLKALLRHLVLDDDHLLILDMEAGLEHMGRSTARSVDVMLIVVEPGQRSVETATRIAAMAWEQGVSNVCAVLNKVSSNRQDEELRTMLSSVNLSVAGSVPTDLRLVDADLAGRPTAESGADSVLQAIEHLRTYLDAKLDH